MEAAPVFLTLDEVVRIHQDQIERYGGSAGIRDTGLLQSAVAMPQAAFGGQFAHADIYEMAAAYVFHLVQNHAFVDGNKRVGAATALVFLEMNDVDFHGDEDDFEALILSVACGQTDKVQIAVFIKANSSPAPR